MYKLHKIQISVSIKLWWNIAMLTHLYISHGDFCATAKPSGCHQDHLVCKARMFTKALHGACLASSDVQS